MKRIVIANFYPVWPPMGGGQRRIFFLARELAKAFDVEIIVPERSGPYEALHLSRHLKEIRIPVEQRYRDLERRLDNEIRHVGDLAYTLHWRECAIYQSHLASRLRGAAAVITAHPYSAYAILDARKGAAVPMVYDSQNVELYQKSPLLRHHPDYLKAIRAIERTAIAESALTIACTNDDARAFSEEYGASRADIEIIENGVDALGVPEVSEDVRRDLRAHLGLGEDQLVAVFGASLHFPNVRAVDAILALAPRVPEVVFVILGTVCRCEALAAGLPANVVVLGAVEESTKWMAFAAADIGLNPMQYGSGTNIKLLEYAAAGLVAVSTRFGARGLQLAEGSEYVVADLDEMAAALRTLRARGRAGRREIGERARSAVREKADWSVIGPRYIRAITRVSQPAAERVPDGSVPLPLPVTPPAAAGEGRYP